VVLGIGIPDLGIGMPGVIGVPGFIGAPGVPGVDTVPTALGGPVVDPEVVAVSADVRMLTISTPRLSPQLTFTSIL